MIGIPFLTTFSPTLASLPPKMNSCKFL